LFTKGIIIIIIIIMSTFITGKIKENVTPVGFCGVPLDTGNVGQPMK
jgi:hypothetical protein